MPSYLPADMYSAHRSHQSSLQLPVLHMLLAHAQASAFDGWVEAVHMTRHNKQIVAKALTRITKLKLSQAFGWWRHQAAALQDARARAGHIIACMQNQCMAAAFHSWVSAVTESREAATRRSQLVDAAVTRSNATLLGQMFVVRAPLLGLCGLVTYHGQTAALRTSCLSSAVTAC